MKSIVYHIIVLALCSYTQHVYAHVALDYPQGGETFYAGEVIHIEWSVLVAHDTENWDLYISMNGGTDWSPLVLNIPVGQLSYLWNVPYLATTQAKIRVVQDNTLAVDYMDTSSTFIIIVPPSDGPLFSLLAQNITFECNAANLDIEIEEWLENNGGAMASGSCEHLTWTNNYTGLSDSCGASGSALVTFTVFDDCGVNVTTAMLYVLDSTPPTIESPALAMQVECDGSGNTSALDNWLSAHGGAVASDACGEISWSYNALSHVQLCGMTETHLVTFSATDACGNSSITIAGFSIIDTTGPVIEIDATDMLVECDGSGNISDLENWLGNHGGAVASDLCGNTTWADNYSTLTENCGGSGNALVTFIASDVCGNAAMTTAQFVIVDSAAPVITSVSRDTSIECHGLNPGPAIQLWLDAHGNAQAEDICGSIIWTHDLMDIPDQCEPYEQVVLFTATDACGNSETTEAVISLSNTVGLEEQKIKNIAFDIFPNPAQEIIHIKFHSDDRQTRDLTLLDVMGRELLHHRGDESEVSLAVSEFAAGFYFLNIRTGDQTSAYMLLIR